jgi:hypothetical protein
MNSASGSEGGYQANTRQPVTLQKLFIVKSDGQLQEVAMYTIKQGISHWLSLVSLFPKTFIILNCN